MKIYISGISPTVTENHLQELYSQFGNLAKIDLLKDPETGLNRGYAFIEFKDEDSANSAILQTQNTLLEGENIQVSVSRSRLDQKRERAKQKKFKPHKNPRVHSENREPRSEPNFNTKSSANEDYNPNRNQNFNVNRDNNRTGVSNTNRKPFRGFKKGVDYGRNPNKQMGSAVPTSFLGQENFAISPRTMNDDYGNSLNRKDFNRK
jgi:RNA recognition motif-containing protein